MSYWISILGEGSWAGGDAFLRGPGSKMVSDETASIARGSGLPWLIVEERDDQPVVPDIPPLSGTLTSADFAAPPPPLETEPEQPDAEAVASPQNEDGRLPCPHGCGKDYASEPALRRHVERTHGVA